MTRKTGRLPPEHTALMTVTRNMTRVGLSRLAEKYGLSRRMLNGLRNGDRGMLRGKETVSLLIGIMRGNPFSDRIRELEERMRIINEEDMRRCAGGMSSAPEALKTFHDCERELSALRYDDALLRRRMKRK